VSKLLDICAAPQAAIAVYQLLGRSGVEETVLLDRRG
jgi:hypothetical protein